MSDKGLNSIGLPKFQVVMFNIKSTGVPVRGHPQNDLDNWDPIF